MPDSVDGAPVKPSYTSVGSGENLVVTDAVTGLEWQGRPGRDNGAALTFEAAQSYCAALNIGTRSQFRLPSQVELASILDTTRSGTSVLLLADRLFLGLATAYWTSTPDPLSPALHRLVSFADGSVASAPASTATARVRCVRSPTPVPSGTPAKRLAPIRVADKRQVLGYRDVRTGIGWALQTSATPLDYAGALAYCQSLGAAGAVGGRLPTYKELLTALDLGPTAPFVDAELAATSGGTFWSASSAPGDTTRAYVVDFTSATGTAQPVTATAYARCVSAGTP